MKQIYKSIAIILILTITVGKSYAQVNNTLYYMSKIPQAKYMNPAYQNDCKLHINGFLLFSSTHFSYDNNFMSLDDFIYQGSGSMSDSLVTAFHSLEDGQKFVEGLRPVNFIRTELDINLLSVGYKYKDYDFSFAIRERFEARASFSQDLVQLLTEGNGKSLIDKDVQLGNFGVTATHFREYDLGVSKKINSKITVGATVKLLFGKENLWTKTNDLTWNTNSQDFAYNFNADIDLRMSQPLYEIEKFEYDYVNDSLIFEDSTYSDLDPIKDVVLNNSNVGFGIDLGAVYKYNDKFTFYASVADLGYIKWKTNTATFQINGQYTYDGFDIQPFFTENDSIIEENTSNTTDSVINIFMPQFNGDPYNSYLTPKIFLGGTYNINEKINIGVLGRGEFFQNKFYSSVTITGNTNFKKWFSATMSYSIMNNSFNNLGIGLMARAGFAQFYIVTDNVLAAFPQSTRTVNYRAGINLLFGCKEKQDNTIIE